jgi:hypothetical protein
MTVSLFSRMRVSGDVLAQEVQGETVLLDLARERYYGLNAMGTRVWAQLGQGLSLSEIHARLLQEYVVEPAVLTQDLIALVEALCRAGLVSVADAEEDAAG